MTGGNKIGGKGYKRGKARGADTQEFKYVSKADFDGSIYARVTQMMGSGQVLAVGEDRQTYQCVIRGRLYKRVWIAKEDYLIILPRDYEKRQTADVLYKLSEEELDRHDVRECFELPQPGEPDTIDDL